MNLHRLVDLWPSVLSAPTSKADWTRCESFGSQFDLKNSVEPHVEDLWPTSAVVFAACPRLYLVAVVMCVCQQEDVCLTSHQHTHTDTNPDSMRAAMKRSRRLLQPLRLQTGSQNVTDLFLVTDDVSIQNELTCRLLSGCSRELGGGSGPCFRAAGL